MPRSRGSDGSQRPSSRVPLYLKTTACSESNSVHRPVAADRSPKVSPRGVLQERKQCTKVADLETKLSIAQEELKKLKDQLALAEASKLEAEQALAKAKKRISGDGPIPKEGEEKLPPPQDTGDEVVTSPAAMDVFEVVVKAAPLPANGENEVESEKEEENMVKREEKETTVVEKAEKGEDDKAAVAEEEGKEGDKELDDLKAKLLEKEQEVEILLEENVIFRTRGEEEAKKISAAAHAKEAKLMAMLSTMGEELEESNSRAGRLAKQLEEAEGTKAMLEAEMKRVRMQMEQWRKAAEAAAAALADNDVKAEVDRRVSERCGSMETSIGWDSPLVAGELEVDGTTTGVRSKLGGIRLFREIWRKKGQQN